MSKAQITPDTDKTTPLDLSKREIAARGNRRDIYLIDPAEVGVTATDQPLVLKVPRYADRLNHPNPLKRLTARLWPAGLDRVNRVEVKYWKKVASASSDDPATLPLPVFYGYVPTTRGTATLWESLLAPDGTLAPTAGDLRLKDALTPAIAPLNRFAEFCFATNLVAPDIRDGNVVVAERAGRAQAVLIDGFGDMRLISIRALSPRRNLACMTERFARMAQKIGLEFDENARTFCPSRR